MSLSQHSQLTLTTKGNRMESITLTRKQAQPIIDRAFPSYSGRKIRVCITEAVVLHDLNWSGGTKNTYVAMRTDDLAVVDLGAMGDIHPAFNGWEGMRIPLRTGFCLIQHSHFCGKDCGLTIYVHSGCRFPALGSRVAGLLNGGQYLERMTYGQAAALASAE